MGDESRPPLHLATRLLPWITGLVAVVCAAPFIGTDLPAIVLCFFFAVLLGIALVARSGLLPGRVPPSVPRVVGIYGASVGAISMTVLTLWWIRHDPAATPALGLIALDALVPLAMLFLGALTWAGTALAMRLVRAAPG